MYNFSWFWNPTVLWGYLEYLGNTQYVQQSTVASFSINRDVRGHRQKQMQNRSKNANFGLKRKRIGLNFGNKKRWNQLKSWTLTLEVCSLNTCRENWINMNIIIKISIYKPCTVVHGGYFEDGTGFHWNTLVRSIANFLTKCKPYFNKLILLNWI